MGLSPLFLALPTMFLGQALVSAQPQPQLPCGQEEAFPTYPILAAAPTVTFWGKNGQALNWKPPACTGWTATGFSTLVTTAARFRNPLGTAGLLRRIGAISELSGLRYWSTTGQRWQALITGAHALTGPQGSTQGSLRRNDFSREEMKEGGVFYYEQLDNLSGKAVYRMRLSEVSDSRIVFDVENVSAMRYFLITLFRPTELQTVYFLDRDMARETADVWRFYSVVRTGKNASGLTNGKPASSINRAIAFFRYVAGIPTDLEPPAAK